MRISNAIAGAFALLLTVEAFAQATEHTIPVVWNPNPLQNPGSCSFFLGTMSATFDDSAGSNWSYLKVRIPLGVVLTQTGQQPPAPPATVSVAINGVSIGSPVLVSNTSISCAGYVTYEFGMQSPLPGYRPLAQNTFTITSSGGHAGNSGEPAELIFRTEPRKFAFDLVPAMSQKVVLHPKPGDTDLSPWQIVSNEPGEKPRFRFRGAVTSNTASLDADVWFRVVDPSDPSTYVPLSQRVPDDNKDPLPKGVLMSRGCADPGCRAASGQPLQVRSSTGGVAELELEATDRYAGDNYYLEASFDPTFTCATAGTNGTNLCARSGQVTAWKRVSIEKRRMLRNGLFLAQDANAGDTFVVTRGNHWFGNRNNTDEISKNEKIVIVHGPQLDRSDLNAGWSHEFHTILSVQDLGGNEFRVNLGRKVGNVVIPEALQRDYRVDADDPRIGDAISKLDDLFLAPNDVFDVPMDLVTGEAFRDSFVENVILPDNTTPGAFVPVPFLESAEQDLLQNLAEKWSSVVDGTLAPNHQLLIIGSDNNPIGPGDSGDEGDAAGLTISRVAGKTSSYVFLDAIDQQVNGNANNANIITWGRKTAAHEIAHQWQTNGIFGRFDHCPPTTRTWNDSNLYCLLADFTLTGAGSIAQRTNGTARFHFMTLPSGSTHSEYLEIRQRPDPFVP